ANAQDTKTGLTVESAGCTTRSAWSRCPDMDRASSLPNRLCDYVSCVSSFPLCGWLCHRIRVECGWVSVIALIFFNLISTLIRYLRIRTPRAQGLVDRMLLIRHATLDRPCRYFDARSEERRVGKECRSRWWRCVW